MDINSLNLRSYGTVEVTEEDKIYCKFEDIVQMNEFMEDVGFLYTDSLRYIDIALLLLKLSVI